MQKILLSLASVVFVGALVVGGTGAFFSDSETSTGNTFTAGALDLKVDSVAHYNGMICFNSGPDLSGGYAWHPFGTTVEWDEGASAYVVVQGIGPTELADEIQGFNEAHPALNPKAGDPCNGTWELTDLGPTHKFFNFSDLKPGDSGENTISIHVYNNDAFMCAAVHNVKSNDNGCTEPESEADTTCGVPGAGEGELDEELNFLIWEDDGDNVFEEGEEVLYEGLAVDGVAGVYPLYTPQTPNGPLTGGTTQYLGVAWCYGTFDGNGVCDGKTVSNKTQTDSLTGDITFYIEQSRNNPNFKCPLLSEFEQRSGSDTGSGTGN